MEEYYKKAHEELKQMVCLHHETINHLLHMLNKKRDVEALFWGSLRKQLEEVK